MAFNMDSVDLKTGRLTMSKTQNVNDALGFGFNDNIPATAFRRAKLLRIMVEAVNAATAHAFSAEEAVLWNVQRAGINVSGRRVLGPLQSTWGDGDSTPQGWNVEGSGNEYEVRGGDTILMNTPPVDDNGAPTGDLQVTLEVEVVEW